MVPPTQMHTNGGNRQVRSRNRDVPARVELEDTSRWRESGGRGGKKRT